MEQIERDKLLLSEERAVFEREKRQHEADKACAEEIQRGTEEEMAKKILELEMQNEILHSTIQDITQKALLESARGTPKIIGIDRSTSPV